MTGRLPRFSPVHKMKDIKKALKTFVFKAFSLVRVARVELTAS